MDRLNRHKLRRAVGAAVAVLLVGISFVRADAPTSQPAPPEPPQSPDGAQAQSPEFDPTKLSIEDLLKVNVYSVSRHAETLADAPAAVSVITQDDMERSGFHSIPDMLRLVPGLDVARINASQFAISSRGFNELFSNKLLVMMDGRSVYTPLFSGVYWDQLDYVLPDLDRIEVIRGPGATLWGSNAVNGVINISTKSAKDTQGWLVDGIGSNETEQGSVRYGGKIDDDTFFRVYSKYRDYNDFPVDHSDAHDGWQDVRAGFRIDRKTDDNTLTFQGDIFNDRTGQTLIVPTLVAPLRTARFVENNFSGGNVLGRWTHTISSTSDFSLQLYYDRQNRLDNQLGYELDTVDLDFQHRFALTKRQEVIWGADVRFTADNIQNTDLGTFDPTRRDDYLTSAFIQDDLTLVPDRMHFILGTKLEQNSYSGFEVQPSARMIWTPNDKNSVWGAVSRAVRTPSRWEQDSRIEFTTVPTQAGIPGEVDTVGQSDFTSEKMTAYELGYRVRATQTLSFDTTAYFNSYSELRSGTQGTPTFSPTPSPHLVIPVALGNDIYGETYGAELSATWAVTQQWRLTGSYTWTDIQLHRHHGVDPTLERTFEGTSPRNQFQLHSYYDITKNIELNSALYYVDDLKTGNIPAYIRCDANVTWRPRENLSVAVGIQNIFDNHHPEFNSGLFFTQTTESPRTYFAEVTWKF